MLCASKSGILAEEVWDRKQSEFDSIGKSVSHEVVYSAFLSLTRKLKQKLWKLCYGKQMGLAGTRFPKVLYKQLEDWSISIKYKIF